MIRHCTGPCGSTFTDRADDFREEAAIALGICPVCSGLLRELETDDRAAQLLGDQHELAGDVVGDLAEALRLLELSHAREEDAAEGAPDHLNGADDDGEEGW